MIVLSAKLQAKKSLLALNKMKLAEQAQWLSYYYTKAGFIEFVLLE